MGRIISAATILIFIPIILFAEQMTPSQLMGKYRVNRTEALKKYIIKSKCLSEGRDTADAYNPIWQRATYELRTDGERIDLIIDNQFGLHSPDEKASPENLSKQRDIWDGKTWSECYYATAPRQVSETYFSMREEEKSEFFSGWYPGSCLDGTFSGDEEPVEVILDRASQINLRSQMENVTGFDCYVIDAVTPNGKYSIWIDPQHNYNVAKVRIHKSGKDVLYGKPINQHEAPVLPEGVKYGGILSGKPKEFFFSLDIVGFQKVGDVWVPAEANYQTITKYHDNRIITVKVNDKRTHIDLDPDFEAVGAFVPDIPDGSLVFLEYAPSIRYIWQDGKAVPDIDQKFLDVLDNEIEQIKSEVKAESVRPTVKQAESPLDETSASEDEQTNSPDSQHEVPAESTSSAIWVSILIGVLIIGVIIWLVYRRFRA